MRLIIILLILAFQSAQAQQYTIIHVIGKIYDNQTQTYLKSGTKLTDDSKLKFETPHARAAALSNTRGRYVIQHQTTQAERSDLAYTLSTVLAPARGKMSTRSGSINNQMDFVKKFGEGPLAIVGGRLATAISPTAYPTDDTHFFYASFLFNNEAINKKLDVIDNQLVFDIKSFYTIDGITIDPKQTSETTLYYYDSNKEESIAITSLDFEVVSDDELSHIAKAMGELNNTEQVNAIREIVTALYGACQADQIKAAIQNLN
ncbi:hypothetical protein N7E81_01170 [Reichenbachiella carrageenanivorans]|uniref:Carboxypeptidase regulatory-like domain-containing protein n=1 Tax=Reichenbachiella carrageenanivorans TaxID=2979869 RepID=A0ABY6D0P2_9BACT|nr:hypothetical protein [Reichenbachiella carrageenanivorans]UXX79721.1 hypothetical protein N7E81_01170 [Reichenbachiella carrageenanivorans]